MAAGVEIKVNKRQLKSIQRQFAGVPKALPKILARSINRTAIGARKETNVHIRADAQLKAGRINKAIKLIRANYRRLSARLNMSPSRIGLVNFGASQTRKGVSYKVRKSDGRTRIEGAWIMTANGVRGVFKRKDDGGIMMLFGPSIGHVFANAGNISGDVRKKAANRLHKEIDAQTALMIRQLKRRA